MNEYLGRTKTEEKKEYVIGAIEQSHSMSNDMEL